MRLDEFDQMCWREWDNGYGDVTGLHLTGESLAELCRDVLAAMNSSGDHHASLVLRVPGHQRLAAATGAAVTEMVNIVTRSVVKVTCWDAEHDTATVTGGPAWPRTREVPIRTVPVHACPASDRMDFSAALTECKAGKRITRAGWNGPGQFVVHQKGYPDGIAINANTAEATGIPQGTICRFAPYLMMRNAQGVFVPWLASQGDLLADDWQVVR